MDEQLTPEERALLLKLARQALQAAVNDSQPPALDLQSLPPALRQQAATFVTLTRLGELRGCIGALEPYQSIAEDACEHAMAAALQDYRFPPVQPEELLEINIEISRLTLPKDLPYDTPQDLLQKLRPHIDGVTLRDSFRRATFLPQVWEKIPDASTFLSHLCQKMGAQHDLWLHKKLQVQTYQVEEFHE